MTWEQIRTLHDEGFEIGNHTRDHMGVSRDTLGRLFEQVEAIRLRCVEHGIPAPTSFAYPGNAITPEAIPLLGQWGFHFARRGGAPERPYDWGRGFAFEPGLDDPLLLPSAGDARPDWTLEDFVAAVSQAKSGKVAILQFHGIPDRDHPWVSTRKERFEEYMAYLHDHHYQVLALRDLAAFVDPQNHPTDPLAVVRSRQTNFVEVFLEGRVEDSKSHQILPCRISIQSQDGQWHFPKSASTSGSAIRYERSNSGNPLSIEKHVTLSAHPFRVLLKPGRYQVRVEHGKEYFPLHREIEVTNGTTSAIFPLERWIDMSQMGWFSGDAHNHRNPADLPNVQLAEDLHVALPMVDWTTDAERPPNISGQGFTGEFDRGVVQIDSTHAWQSRNTEYEIFKAQGNNHTLGAFLILNHKRRMTQTVVPLAQIEAQAHAEGALIDLEKHNWPWSVAIVPLLHVDLFELANNHHWEVPYAVRNWAVPAPEFMHIPGTGTDSELGWTLYGFQTYYALLNCGFWLRPSAGTANGVHPVPLGFSRVYVHLNEPFSFNAWMKGLGEGRSFVTTGPMLIATSANQIPESMTRTVRSGEKIALECTARSARPLESLELIVNGKLNTQAHITNQPHPLGGYENHAEIQITLDSTSWVAWRCFERGEGDRFRFAHTAAMRFQIDGKPLLPRTQEVQWLHRRVQDEMDRSRGKVSEVLLREYETALRSYENLLKQARD